ncbi:hypothetical protein GCM10020220_085370 [Nonomuraea rubra]
MIAGGGGGAPVSGDLTGIEAVVDKDAVAALLATQLEADLLAILTDVPYVYADYGTPRQRPITTATPDKLDGDSFTPRLHGAQGGGGLRVRPRHRPAGGHRRAGRARAGGGWHQRHPHPARRVTSAPGDQGPKALLVQDFLLGSSSAALAKLRVRDPIR